MNVTRKMLMLRPDLQEQIRTQLLSKAVCRDCGQRQTLCEASLTIHALTEDYCEACFSSHLTYSFEDDPLISKKKEK